MSIREIALECGPDTRKWPTYAFREALEEWYKSELLFLGEALSNVTATEGDCIALLSAYQSISPVGREAIIGKMVVRAMDRYAEENLEKIVDENYQMWLQEDAA
jgi:hypothetical protein